jgi:hypothetical protein
VVTALVGVLFISALLIIVAYERENQRMLYNALYETIVVFARSIDRELATVERLSVDIMSGRGTRSGRSSQG